MRVAPQSRFTPLTNNNHFPLLFLLFLFGVSFCLEASLCVYTPDNSSYSEHRSCTTDDCERDGFMIGEVTYEFFGSQLFEDLPTCSIYVNNGNGPTIFCQYLNSERMCTLPGEVCPRYWPLTTTIKDGSPLVLSNENSCSSFLNWVDESPSDRNPVDCLTCVLVQQAIYESEYIQCEREFDYRRFIACDAADLAQVALSWLSLLEVFTNFGNVIGTFTETASYVCNRVYETHAYTGVSDAWIEDCAEIKSGGGGDKCAEWIPGCVLPQPFTLMDVPRVDSEISLPPHYYLTIYNLFGTAVSVTRIDHLGIKKQAGINSYTLNLVPGTSNRYTLRFGCTFGVEYYEVSLGVRVVPNPAWCVWGFTVSSAPRVPVLSCFILLLVMICLGS